MIESLTPEQIAKFPEYVAKWTAIGLSTEPADRPAAERAIALCYTLAGLEPPKTIIWCGSPLAMTLARDRALNHSGPVLSADSHYSGGRLGGIIYGSHDAGWLSFYDYFRHECGLVAETEKLQGLVGLAKSAGWALPHTQTCWISERHNVLARDDAGRIHNLTGPAIAYPDGWSIYAVRGTRVPSEWIERKAELDPRTALTWENIEQRSAAAEIIGWERIMSVLEPRVIDRNRSHTIGTLLEVDLPDAPGSRFLRVVCPTGRTFVLPVPRELTTARQANAWTYGLDAQDYELETRT
jgi:hypothetical protein